MQKLRDKINEIDDKECFIVLILTTVSFLVTLYFPQKFLWFQQTLKEQRTILFIARTVCFLVIGLFWTGIVIIIKQLIKGNKKAKSFVKYFLPYFFIILIILFFTYPGIFKGDEFYVLANSIMLKLEYQQHYLTDMFYIVCLMIYPTMVTITIMQVFIISTIVAKTLQEAEELFNNKKLVWLFYIPLLFLPVIDNNLFPLRNSIITYLFLRMIFKIWVCSKKDNISWNNRVEIIVLVSIISALKTEFMYLILIIPFVTKMITTIKWKETITTIIIMMITFKIINLPQKDPYNNTYVLTALFNPLSMIVKDENVRGLTQKDIDNINNVTNYEELKKQASFINIPIYFSPQYTHVKVDDYKKRKFELTCFKLFICNIDMFLINRVKTFIYTSGLKKNYINHTGHENPNWTLYLDYNNGKCTKEYMKYNEPILGYEIRKKVISFITCRNPNNYTETNLIYPIIYNVLPQLFGLIIVLIYYWRKKQHNSKGVCLIILTVLLQFPIIFLTAPAAFWMYYMPLYMSGNMIITYTIINYIDKRKE